MRRFPPERIICLTEETVETLYLLGEQARIVGISGFTVRPPQARKEKPKVSAFTSAVWPSAVITLSGADTVWAAAESRWAAGAVSAAKEGRAPEVVVAIPATRPRQTSAGVTERSARRGIRDVLPGESAPQQPGRPAVRVLGWTRRSQLHNSFWTSPAQNLDRT